MNIEQFTYLEEYFNKYQELPHGTIPEIMELAKETLEARAKIEKVIGNLSFETDLEFIPNYNTVEEEFESAEDVVNTFNKVEYSSNKKPRKKTSKE